MSSLITTSAAVQEEQSKDLSSVETLQLIDIEKQLVVLGEKVDGAYIEIGNLLRIVRDGKLYRENYPTFEEYVQQRWKMEARRAYKYISSSSGGERILCLTGHIPSQAVADQVSKIKPLDKKEVEERLAKVPPKQLSRKVVVQIEESVTKQPKSKKETERQRKIKDLQEKIDNGPRGGFRAIGLQNELAKLIAEEKAEASPVSEAEIVAPTANDYRPYEWPPDAPVKSNKAALLAELAEAEKAWLHPNFSRHPETIRHLIATFVKLVNKHF